MTDNTWSSAAEKINLNVDLDEGLRTKLRQLAVKQARDSRLAQALEQGRSYQMRQMHAQILQQRSLNHLLSTVPLTTSPLKTTSSA